MKKIFMAIAFIALPLMMVAQAPKFGVVTGDEILLAMPEMTEIQNKIAEASKQYEDEYGRLNEELQRKFGEYQQLEADASTPQSIKERRLQEIQDLDRKAQQFAQTAQQDLQRQQAQLLQPVQERLLQTIKAVSEEQGLLMVFPDQMPLYVSAEVVDITPLVKASLGIK